MCGNCGHGGREQGLEQSTSLTTIALETKQIARQLGNQATVERLSVDKGVVEFLLAAVPLP